MISEHSLVVLDTDPPHERLSRGDVGTVVHVYKGGKGYEVEFVDGGGQTVALITVDRSAVRPINAGEFIPSDRGRCPSPSIHFVDCLAAGTR